MSWKSWALTAFLLSFGFGCLIGGGGILYASIVEEDPYLALWTALPWVLGAVAIAWGLQRILPVLHVRELSIATDGLRHGQPIAGQLTLAPWFSASIQGIQLQLVLSEGDMRSRQVIHSPLASLPLADRQVVREELVLPFDFAFPEGGPASFEDDDVYVRYQLQAQISLPYRLQFRHQETINIQP